VSSLLLRPKPLIFKALVLLVCTACATVRPPAPEPGGFALTGKLAVVEGTESYSARFLWSQAADRFEIDLWGPLGHGRLRLLGDERELALVDGDGTVLTRGPHEEIMERNLGWSLPLAVLPEWVRGRPHPALPVEGEEFDAEGRLTAFRQLDWDVVLRRFRRAPQAPAAGELPFLVSATRNTHRVRLAITDWKF
jgi:outer membrane lipoprotein LolB